MAAADLVNEFARFLGMESPAWNGEGAAEFAFPRGRVVFETAEDDLLLYLTGKPLPFHHPRLAERMLRLGGEMRPLPVHAGLAPGGEPVFLVRLAPQRQNLPALEQGLEQLFALQDRLNAEEEPVGPAQAP